MTCEHRDITQMTEDEFSRVFDFHVLEEVGHMKALFADGTDELACKS